MPITSGKRKTGKFIFPYPLPSYSLNQPTPHQKELAQLPPLLRTAPPLQIDQFLVTFVNVAEYWVKDARKYTQKPQDKLENGTFS